MSAPGSPPTSSAQVGDVDRAAVDVLLAVRQRLEAAGAHSELLRLARMSPDELRVVVEQEIHR